MGDRGQSRQGCGSSLHCCLRFEGPACAVSLIAPRHQVAKKEEKPKVDNRQAEMIRLNDQQVPLTDNAPLTEGASVMFLTAISGG